MASTSRNSTYPLGEEFAPSTSTSDGSFCKYETPATKVAFQNDKRYHVFLSFRGPDVRKTLVDHLFQALSVAGLDVFLDTEELEKGEIIGLSLEKAIESSAIRIPIFSKGYADSTWCLREAAAMLETPGLTIPLFYYVDPTHVRYPEKGSSPYRQSFGKHYRYSDRPTREDIEWWKHALLQICPCLEFCGHSVRHKREEVDKWKHALHQICERSGWSMDITDGFEARMVKMVMNDLIRTFDRVPLEVAKHPVGLDGVKNTLIHKLNLNSKDEVIKVGIWGIGGVGKTTVAKAMYNQVYADFDAASFVFNVCATAEEPTGLTKLQEIILNNLSEYAGKLDSVDKGISLFRNRLGGKRVLLVLDDVDAVVQLNVLFGDWLAPGSRVIVTSRDKHILNIARITSECIHEMSGLEINEGLQLFSWYAFLGASPSSGYEDLSKRIVGACKGHPLSLEVIGSLLYDKQDDTSCWTEALENITLDPEIYERLYISYKALSDEEKEIFVDIACFFIGERKTLPIVFWESLYKKVHIAISNLSMKLLIKIDERGLFDMHDHLRDMGRTIAEKKGNRKWEPSHLSTISNDLSRLRLIGGNPLDCKMICTGQSLEMIYTDGLRYLHLQNLYIECVTKDTIFIVPPSLIWLRLENCGFIVVEKPSHSRIVDNIRQCKIIQLKGCGILSSLPAAIGNLSQLRHLDLQECEGLSGFPATIGNLSQLQDLNLQECESLSSLPDTIGNLSQLRNLGLQWCKSLSSLPDSIGKLSQLQKLDMQCCKSLSNLPNSIGNLSQLKELHLYECKSLNSLSDSIGTLPQLEELDLYGCESLSSLPDSIGNLSQLHKLDMQWCIRLSSLPDSIGKLSQLKEFHLYNCKSLSRLPDSIGNLSQLPKLNLKHCESFK